MHTWLISIQHTSHNKLLASIDVVISKSSSLLEYNLEGHITQSQAPVSILDINANVPTNRLTEITLLDRRPDCCHLHISRSWTGCSKFHAPSSLQPNQLWKTIVRMIHHTQASTQWIVRRLWQQRTRCYDQWTHESRLSWGSLAKTSMWDHLIPHFVPGQHREGKSCSQCWPGWGHHCLSYGWLTGCSNQPRTGASFPQCQVGSGAASAATGKGFKARAMSSKDKSNDIVFIVVNLLEDISYDDEKRMQKQIVFIELSCRLSNPCEFEHL